MTGAQLKAEIVSRNVTQKSIAEKLGMTDQNFGKHLKKEHIAPKFLEAVAEALEVPVSELLASNGDTITAIDNSTAFKGINSCDSRLLDIIQSRDRQFDKAQEQIDKLLKLLEVYTEK